MALIPPVAAMALLGAVLGLILAYVARRFHVPTNPRVDEINSVLPGANCGGCGFAGCAAFAEAVAAGQAAPALCGAGGMGVARRVGDIMGLSAEIKPGERLVASVHCRRRGVAEPGEYKGIRTCRAANLPGLSGGPTACRYGCLGFGDCISACPFGALSAGGEGEPIVVDEVKCTGCRKCEKACPRGILEIARERRTVLVGCRNRDKGPQAYQICQHACIACRKCEKACPFDAIHVPNFLAEIDYEKCKLCAKCVGVCPRETILDLRAVRRRKAEAAAAAGQTPPAEAAYDRG